MKLLEKFTKELHRLADPDKAKILQWFFKTGKGEYGEGDKFLGITVPKMRTLCKNYLELSLADIEVLLASKWHEKRFAALLLLVAKYQRASKAESAAAKSQQPGSKKARSLQAENQNAHEIFEFYLAHTATINNWDLVDVSASYIIGHYLFTVDSLSIKQRRTKLHALARSNSLWERRIAIVATHYFIRSGFHDDTLVIAEKLLGDKEDLIHKAVGWMLREVGKRDARALQQFLQQHHQVMPRMMLRYAIERLPERERRRYLERKKK